MPSILPNEPALTKAVKDFGIGTYDSQRDSQLHGEDDEEGNSGKSLPDNGGPLDPFGPDRSLGYPQEYTSQNKHAFAELPGDLNRPPTRRRPEDDTKTSPVPSVAKSGLPTDEENVSARSDYYDDMKIGKGKNKQDVNYDSYPSELWPDENIGAYASDSLPSQSSLDATTDNWLGALGNFWSGFIVEDQAVPEGFPSENFKENAEYTKTNEPGHGGRTMAFGIMKERNMRRTATDLELVGELTSAFLKKCGKTNITRRCITAFLQETGYGDRQYLASDMVRCLKYRHKVTIVDALDQFPIAKQASNFNLSGIRAQLLKISYEHDYESDEAIALRRCASQISLAMKKLEKVNG